MKFRLDLPRAEIRVKGKLCAGFVLLQSTAQELDSSVPLPLRKPQPSIEKQLHKRIGKI